MRATDSRSLNKLAAKGALEPVLNLSDRYYRMYCPFSTATQDDNYAGDKHLVFDCNGSTVAIFPTRFIADEIARRMNELAAKAFMVEGTKAEGHG